jgi:neurotransmitter:Na+ symporter, NSS family
METSNTRETLGSRLGFLMLSVGCAVGLGNVWRFPFICGKYGGGWFVLLYLLFLVLLGFPVLMMELAVGRAGRANIVGSYRKLAQHDGNFWAAIAKIIFCGNVVLMIYYTTISGWLLAYTRYYVGGEIMKCSQVSESGELLIEQSRNMIGEFFGGLAASPGRSLLYMLITVALGALVCSGGVRKTVESSAKYMMSALFVLLFILVVHSLRLSGAAEGLKFYLVPNWANFSSHISETVFAAMGQAFFTLSLGVGSMEIFGSYLGWKKSLAGESASIIIMDTIVATGAGLIIFPACYTYGVEPNAGPGLIFMSLPNVFQQMPGGRFWGVLFFLFMTFAAFSTVIAVFENIIAYAIDEWKIKRWQASLMVGLGIAALSVPCVLGFNVWSDFHPFGGSTGILDLEDFVVSQNLLPLGSLLTALFCCWGIGWGMNGFIDELNEGQNWKWPKFFQTYCRFAVPVIILVIFVFGYINFFK